LIITSRAPVRIDFAGGWTDVDIFAKSVGGAVLNATIDKYVTGRLEIRDGSIGEDGKYQDGITISYHSDLPAGSGLGTSSALNVVWLSLVKSRIASMEDKKVIANLAYELEAILGILGGKQDQYASALGGFNYMVFGDEVKVEQLNIRPEVVEELEERLVLCYTGKQRLSGNIHENVWGAYKRGVPSTVNALYSLRDIAGAARNALVAGDLDEFAYLINQNWECQKKLDKSITNDQIEQLFEEAFKHGAVSGKACGAGGGGCLLFLTKPGGRHSVEEVIERLGSRIIPFKFEFDGLQINSIG
jgi:D-glycero-alpha-D-manno-heptose-7-phosphate kinase